MTSIFQFAICVFAYSQTHYIGYRQFLKRL
jgi:hypothetical protein